MTTNVAANRWIIIDPADFASFRYVKIRSGTSGTPVNQTGNRSLTVVLRQVT